MSTKEIIDNMIIQRQKTVLEAQSMKINVIGEKNKPDIVVDAFGSKNVNQNDVTMAVNQLNTFIAIAEAQIQVLEELKGYIVE